MNGKAPGEHRSRLHWLQAVQNRPGSAGRLTGAQQFSRNIPKHDPHDHFARSLRKKKVPHHNGVSTLDPRIRPDDEPFMSTSDFLREQFGMSPLRNSTKQTDAKSQHAPLYKTPEEYYDEVLSLRKQITEMFNESSILKAKQRRLEDELARKEKELVQNIEKKLENGEVSNRPTEKSAGPKDKTATVNNLKLRVFKLEQKYRSKEAECKRLESDIKATDAEELRIQLDTCLNQIATLRYHNAKIMSGQTSDRTIETTHVVESAKSVEHYALAYSDDETESFTSDSETGYSKHRKSRSLSQSRTDLESRIALARQTPVLEPPTPSIPHGPPSPTPSRSSRHAERPPSADSRRRSPRCNLKEHERLEEVGKEIEDALEKIRAEHDELAKGTGPVRLNQKMTLRGRPGERLLALDRRETELLQKIDELTKENEESKEKLKDFESDLSRHREKADNDNVTEIQALLRAHQIRVEEKTTPLDSRRFSVDDINRRGYGNSNSPNLVFSPLSSSRKSRNKRGSLDSSSSKLFSWMTRTSRRKGGDAIKEESESLNNFLSRASSSKMSEDHQAIHREDSLSSESARYTQRRPSSDLEDDRTDAWVVNLQSMLRAHIHRDKVNHENVLDDV